MVVHGRDVSDVPQNFRDLACCSFPVICFLLAVPETANKNHITLCFEEKIKKIVKFAGTAQSSSGFPKN
jgi:hypothetical protein